jgi:hypothetical protein
LTGVAGAGRYQISDDLEGAMIEATGQNLVFVLSLPRSGSTLLSALLANHPKVVAPPEPWLLLRLAGLLGPGHDSPPHDDYLAGLAIRRFVKEETFVDAARAFALTVYNSILTERGASYLVDKTPRYYHILDFIDRLFPAAKKIWIKRHPLDVAASYKMRWGLGVDVLLGEKPDPAMLDFAVGLPALRDYFSRADQDKYELRYEDLVRDPRGQAERLAAFCGFAFDPAMAQVSPESRGVAPLKDALFGDPEVPTSDRIRDSAVGRWRTDLTAEESRRLAGFVGRDAFARMGYDCDEDQAAGRLAFDLSDGEREALRQHVLGRASVINESRVAALYERDARIRSCSAEAERCAVALAQCQQQQARLEAALAEGRQERDGLQAALAEGRQERDGLQSALAEGRQERDGLQAAVAAQRQEASGLREALRLSEHSRQTVLAAYSYRVGRVVLAPARLVRLLASRVRSRVARRPGERAP